MDDAIEGCCEVWQPALCVGELVADVDVRGGEDADEDLVGFLGLCWGFYNGRRGWVGGEGPGYWWPTGGADDIAVAR